MIGVLDTLTGNPCHLCGEPIASAWGLHETPSGEWVTICGLCALEVGALY